MDNKKPSGPNETVNVCGYAAYQALLQLQSRGKKSVSFQINSTYLTVTADREDANAQSILDAMRNAAIELGKQLSFSEETRILRTMFRKARNDAVLASDPKSPSAKSLNTGIITGVILPQQG